MTLVVSKDYNQPYEFIKSFIKYRAVPSSGKAGDVKFAEGRTIGFEAGLATGLAAWATQERFRNFPRIVNSTAEGWMDAVDEFEAMKVLRDARRFWKELDKDTPEEEWWRNLVLPLIEKLVYSERLASREERLRRDFILSGVEDPTPEDREWLLKEGNNFKSMADPYEQALSKLPPTPAEVTQRELAEIES